MKPINSALFDSIFTGLERSMDLTWRRGQAISSNIANAETPGYRSVDVSFGGELDRAFGGAPTEVMKTDAHHIDLSEESESHTVADFSGVTKPDGNNVDIDVQMGRLAYNSGRYSLGSTLLRKKFQFLASAIRLTA